MLRKRFEKWRLPFIKEEIVGLIRNEIKKYEKATADFSLKFSSRIFPNDATRDYVRGTLEGYYIENFEKMIYKKAYSNIIDICDKAFEHIKELCDKIHAAGFKPVLGQEAQHKETYSVYVNYQLYCDITYVPNKIYNKIKFIEIDNIRYVH
ncbi:MAG: hypothetical protein EB127_13110, partial [Alphaproteobacteria bacterium]|nr:hypothetical protein [Alphaproteobacteria bacterium]